MKRRVFLIAVFVLAGLLPAACQAAASPTPTFSQLVAHAKQYNGKTVTFDAIYFNGRGMSLLSESIKPSDAGGLLPEAPVIWVEGGIPVDLQGKLAGETNPASGETEQVGKLRVTGKFESGGGYGHMGGFEHQLKVEKAGVLDWSPPPGFALLPPAEPVTTLYASVSAIDISTGRLTVYDLVGKKEYQLTIDNTTQVMQRGQPAGLSAITAGSPVNVAFDNTTMVAKKILTAGGT